MFRVRRVDREVAEAAETLGSKPKFWFSDGERRMLFKAEDRGTGEDWAEVVACHLCDLLGLPHVVYELAEEFDRGQRVRPGVVCQNLAEPPTSLVLGNELLLGRDPNYPSASRRRVRQHTIAAIVEVVRTLELPGNGWSARAPSEVRSALDVFAGYLLLDAWIANQDRHHENWGALRDDALRLAPTFDHGASLARNISDDERLKRLMTRDQNYTVEAFASKAQSALFAMPAATQPLNTLDAFLQFAQSAPGGARAWLCQLAGLTRGPIEAILSEVPNHRMSSICKRFTLEVLWWNRQRLLEAEIV